MSLRAVADGLAGAGAVVVIISADAVVVSVVAVAVVVVVVVFTAATAVVENAAKPQHIFLQAFGFLNLSIPCY